LFFFWGGVFFFLWGGKDEGCAKRSVPCPWEKEEERNRLSAVLREEEKSRPRRKKGKKRTTLRPGGGLFHFFQEEKGEERELVGGPQWGLFPVHIGSFSLEKKKEEGDWVDFVRDLPSKVPEVRRKRGKEGNVGPQTE